MILIVSEESDLTTLKVIEWLTYYNAPYIRINNEDEIEIKVEVTKNSFLITHKGIVYDMTEIKGIWYRRGWLTLPSYFLPSENYIINKLISYYKHDLRFLEDYFHRNLFKNSLGSILNANINKNCVLQTASINGLLVPPTLITNKREDLLSFLKENSQIITKTINEQILIKSDELKVLSYTELITEDLIKKLPERFGYSLFQKLIFKAYEVRAFFLDDKFYSMAIFSQDDPQTQVDFRKYNIELPNRVTSYKLPEHIESKLLKTVKFHNLNTGSIDLIVDKNGDYYFLEVNPVGQFGMVSYPCNYYLEEKVALWLINCK